MPKLVVVYNGAARPAAALAAAVADGARTIRFTEVDVRVLGSGEVTPGTGARAKRLESVDALSGYDGVVIVAGSDGTSDEVAALLDTLDSRATHAAEHHGSAEPFANTVFAVTGEGAAALLGRVSRLGAIIVGDGAIPDAEGRARRVGARAAKVIGWVRHALGHEADADHHHGHGHDDQHDHHHHEHGHSHDHHHE